MMYYLIGIDGELLDVREVSEASRFHWNMDAGLDDWFGDEADAKADLAEAIQEGRTTGGHEVCETSELELMWDNGGPEGYFGCAASGEEWIDEDEFSKRYNKAKSTEILHRSNDLPAGDFRSYNETLYLNDDETYFLVGSGGPMTRWASERGNGWFGFGSGIMPISEREALDLIEEAGVTQ